MAVPKGYVQCDEWIDVPKNAGIEGFLRTIRDVLKLPRVQEIRITNTGRIEYSFFLREGEEKRTTTMQFDDLMPMALVRNAVVSEIAGPDASAPIALLQMFRAASFDHLQPIAFVLGTNSSFWPWYESTAKFKADIKEVLAGLPVYSDKACPDEVLVMCAAFKKDAELVEMRKAYKISIPVVTP